MQRSLPPVLGALLALATAAPIAAQEGPPAADTEPAPAVAAGADLVRLTVDECVKRAVARSDQLAAQRYKLAAIEAQMGQLFWAPLSKFSVEGFFSVVPDKCVDKELLESEGRVLGCQGGGVSAEEDYATSNWGPTFRLEVKGGVPIYTFGKISNAKDALEHAHAAKEASLPALEHDIRLKVRQAYNAISGAREMLYTIKEGRKHLVKARKRVEKNLENEEGTDTQVDLLKLKVFESEVDYLEVQTLEIERVALAALRMLVGGEDAARIDIVDEPLSRSEAEVDALEVYQEQALAHRPELAALRHAVKALEAKVDMRRSEFAPDLLLVGGFRYSVTPGRTDIDNWTLKDDYNFGPGFAVGLVLSYDLDWGLDHYKLEEAKAELAAITANQKAALDGVMLEVERAYLHAVALRDGLAALSKSKRSVKGWMAAVLQGHAAGLSTAKEVKDALKEYFSVMAGIHRATAEYNASLADLERVTGVVSGAASAE
jgi:outer membrane protein TolC